MYYKLKKLRNQISYADILFSAIIASIFIGGYILNTYKNLDVDPLSASKILVYSSVFLLYFFISFFILRFMYHLSTTLKPDNYNLKILHKLSFKKYWLLLTTLIFVCYIPIILSTVSILTPDSWSSIRQSIGNTPLTNAHPIIFTFFVSLFIKIGLVFGSMQIGFLLFSVMQASVLSLIFAYIIMWLHRLKVSRYLLITIFVFYAIFPLNSFMTVVMWKDILFAGFGLILLTLTIDLYRDKSLSQYKFIASFILIAFLFCTWRLNGIYTYLLFVSVFLLINYKKILNVRYSGTLLAPLVLYVIYSIIVGVVTIPHHSPAPYTVPLQQIARTVTYHEDSLTEKQKSEIGEILDYKDIKNSYNPNLADPMFEMFKYDIFASNKPKYIKLWLSIGITHKKTYIASLIYSNYRYFYPYFVAPSTFNIVDDNSVQSGSLKSYRDTVFVLGFKRAAAEYHNTSFAIVPMFYSIGFYTLILIASLYIAIKKKQEYLTGVFVILFALMATTLMGPVNGELRYLYLFVLSAPFIIVSVYYNKPIEKYLGK